MTPKEARGTWFASRHVWLPSVDVNGCDMVKLNTIFMSTLLVNVLLAQENGRKCQHFEFSKKIDQLTKNLEDSFVLLYQLVVGSLQL